MFSSTFIFESKTYDAEFHQRNDPLNGEAGAQMPEQRQRTGAVGRLKSTPARRARH